MTDEEAREIIVTDLESNIIVSASAGSGKTSMLVQRMVALVESGVDVSKIAAITFTKKAANEFYERFYTLLKNRSNGINEEHSFLPLANDPKKQELDLKALKEIDLCFLGTIDAFCYKILKQYPLEAGIPFNAQLIEDLSSLNNVFVDYFNKAKIGYFDSDSDEYKISELAKEFEDFFPTYYQQNFLKLIALFFENANYTIEYEDYYSNDIQDIKENLYNYSRIMLDETYGLINMIQTNPNYESNYFGNKNTKRVLRFLLSFNDYSKLINKNDYAGCYELITKYFKYMVFKDDAHTEIKNLYYRDAKQKTTNYIYKDSFLEDCCNRFINSLQLTFASRMYKIIEADFKRQGILTFATSMVYLNDLLKKDNKKDVNVISKIQKQFTRFLIDEFQDTSPIQSEIFFRINSTTRGENWKNFDIIPGSIFVVGDPKQGIYHFRGADIISYLKMKKLFVEPLGKQINLTNNYRSCTQLCEDFNNVFQELLKENEYQESYPAIPLNDKKIRNDIFTGKYAVLANEKYRTLILANLINKLVKMKIPIKDKNELNQDIIRNVKYSDFMVITYNKKEIKNIVEELNKNNIPSFAEGQVDFNTRLVSSFIYLFKYALFGYSVDLFLAKKFIFDIDIEKEKTKNSKKVDNLAKFLRKKYLENKNYNEILINLANSSLLLSYVPCRGIETYYAIVNIIKEKIDKLEIVGEKELSDKIDEILNDSKIERVSPISINQDMVQVANLHKVKGLERPIVILYPCYSVRSSSPKSYIDEDKKIYYPTSLNKERTIKRYRDFYEKEKKYYEEETKRLLYVAETRAKQAVFIMHNGVKSFWFPLFKGVQDIEDLGINIGELCSGLKKSFLENLKDDELLSFEDKNVSKEVSKCSKKSRNIISPSKSEKEYKRSLFEESSLVSKQTALSLGSATHKLMETIVLNKDKELDINVIIDNVCSIYNLDEAYKDSLLQVYKTMTNGGYPQISGAPQDLLSFIKNATCLTEVPFSYIEETTGDIVLGYIDLVIIKDDKYIIIDYKTDKNLETNHENQLEYYENSLRKQIGDCAKIDKFIYNISLDKK